jgi:hypothetical protein
MRFLFYVDVKLDIFQYMDVGLLLKHFLIFFMNVVIYTK